MRYRFFAIPARDPGAAQEELNAFLAGHRIATVERHLVADGDASFWAVSVAFLEGAGKLPAARAAKVDYREVLSERDFALFARLRSLRKSLAEQEGMPAYALFTNEQLAAMVQQRARTAADLGAIEGIGKARVEKYGAAFLALLREGGGPAEEGADGAAGAD